MIENIMLAFLILALAALAIDHWPLTLEQEHASLYQQFLRTCQRRGLTAEEMDAEHRFRRAMAKLRRRASDEVMHHPRSHNEVIKRIAVEEAEHIARFDRKVARRFLQVVEGSPLGDILYPAAAKAVHRAAVAHGRSLKHRISHDDIAALRTN